MGFNSAFKGLIHHAASDGHPYSPLTQSVQRNNKTKVSGKQIEAVPDFRTTRRTDVFYTFSPPNPSFERRIRTSARN